MSFAPIAWVDVHELACSLRDRSGLFAKPGEARVVMLRGPRAEGDPEDDAAFVAFKSSAKWPELTNVLGQLKRLGPEKLGAEIGWGRIYLEMLMPGGIIPWERAEGGYAQRFSRVHVALRTNPTATTFAGGMAGNLQPGIVNLIDRSVPYSALNLGTSYRCHLVCDFRRREESEP